MILLLALCAAAALALWGLLLVRASRASQEAPEGAGRARRLNRAFLAATLAAGFASCAAPIVPLMAAFDDVANAPPERKAQVLDEGIGRDRPLMPLALAGIGVLLVGLNLFVANGRRLRSGAGRRR